MESAGGFGLRPTTRRSKGEDVEPSGGRIIGPFVRLDALDPNILDPQFLAEKVKFLFQFGAARTGVGAWT